jgi:hypothetical protein
VPSPSQAARAFEGKFAHLTVEKCQQLRIRQKDIDVMAIAMVDLQHHCGAAAKSPIIDDGAFRVHLLDKRTRYPK